MTMMQMFIREFCFSSGFESSLTSRFADTELIPRRSRSMVRTAYGQFKDLQDFFYEETDREDLVKRLGLPLVVSSLTLSFCRFSLTLPALNSMATPSPPPTPVAHLQSPNRISNCTSRVSGSPILPSTTSPRASLNSFVRVKSRIICSSRRLVWSSSVGLSLVSEKSLACLAVRRFSLSSLPFAKLTFSPSDRAAQQALAPSEIVTLWSALDQIHQSIQNLQHYLTHLDRLPTGCEADGTAHLHLRFITRMDREVDNVTWLVHSLIVERRDGFHGVRDEIGVEWAQESERRVRKGLKLAA